MGSLLSSFCFFLVGLISVSELEDLYSLLNELAIKTREYAVKSENIRSIERLLKIHYLYSMQGILNGLI